MMMPVFWIVYVRPAFSRRNASSNVIPLLMMLSTVRSASAGDFAAQNFWNAASIFEASCARRGRARKSPPTRKKKAHRTHFMAHIITHNLPCGAARQGNRILMERSQDSQERVVIFRKGLR